MKQLSILMILPISLYLTACSNEKVKPQPATTLSTAPLTQLYAEAEKTDTTKGGNPEVQLIHQCLNKGNTKALDCLKQIIAKERTVYISMNDNWKPIVLGGRGESMEKRKIDLSQEKELIIYLVTPEKAIGVTAI